MEHVVKSHHSGIRYGRWAILVAVLSFVAMLAITAMCLLQSPDADKTASTTEKPPTSHKVVVAPPQPARDFFLATSTSDTDCFELPLELVSDREAVAKQSNLGTDHTRTDHLRRTFLFDERENIAKVPYEAPVPAEVKALRWVLIRSDGPHDVTPAFIQGEIHYDYITETEQFSDQRHYLPGLACVRHDEQEAEALFATYGPGDFASKKAELRHIDVVFENDGKQFPLWSNMERWPEVSAFILKDPENRNYLVAGWQERADCEVRYELYSLEKSFPVSVLSQFLRCDD